MTKRVLVAGAGASGLMAAIFAARAGAKVTILEAMDRPGRKLLMTGNGRCNLTNMDTQLSAAYRGGDPSFAGKIISRFDAEAVRSFFLELGLLTMQRGDCVYPYTNQASSVLEVLLAETRRLNVTIKLTEKIETIQHQDGIWKVRTATWTYQADRLILCCGSKCIPATGSDGSGYTLARSVGLKLNRVTPSLVPLICEGKFLSQLAGVRCPACITLYRRMAGQKEQMLGSEAGELQWTAYGISGIAVFQLSGYAAAARDTDKVRVSIDFLPQYSDEEVLSLLRRCAQRLGKEHLPTLLRGILPEKLIPVLLNRAGFSPKQACSSLQEEDLQKLLLTCRQFSMAVKGTKSFDVCQVCAGGVSCSELNTDTLECLAIPGLYLAGELVDVDGPCGGYNLQWAWSSGFVAGSAAAK